MATFRPAPASSMARVAQVVLVLLVAVVGIIAALVLAAPRHVAYRLTEDQLIVEAPLGFWEQGRSFDRDALRSGRTATLTSGRRYAGTGLPDFCLGRWGQAGLGEVWQATTCGPDAVVFEVEGLGMPLVLSPAERTAFLDAAHSGQTGDFAAAPPPQSAHSGWLSLLGISMVLMFAGLVALMVLSPLRLRYEIADQELRIHTVWGTRRVSLVDARVRADPDARLSVRLFGIGMPGHQLGLYRAGGRTVLAYLTSRRHGVWVEPARGRPVLLSPQDATGFIEAARAT